MKKIVFILLIITNGIALAQEGNVLFRTTDSIVATISPTTIVNDIPECKHQIGIGLSKFVNAAFPSDSNAFLLEYRYLKTSSFAYRIGGDYGAETAKDSSYELALKIGVSQFKEKKDKFLSILTSLAGTALVLVAIWLGWPK